MVLELIVFIYSISERDFEKEEKRGLYIRNGVYINSTILKNEIYRNITIGIYSGG
jgi:hypothetical protein